MTLGLIIGVLVGIALARGYSKDDTDPASGRSGLGLYIDARTGCHYIAPFFGGLTPRLDRNGKHICEDLKVAEEATP